VVAHSDGGLPAAEAGRDAALIVADVGAGSDAGSRDAAAAEAGVDGGDAVDAGPGGLARCFGRNPGQRAPDYTPFAPRIAPHCLGTDHQTIEAIERVVFLGDSVTVGTLPTDARGFYRSILAQRLARHFGIAAPSEVFGQVPWQILDMQGGVLTPHSGAFSTCAKWGARTDDLVAGGAQLARCFATQGTTQKTLIVMTLGGNDLMAIQEAGSPGGDGVEAAQALTERTIEHLRAGLAWIFTPGRFSSGVDVVLASPFEFTDGTGRADACPGAEAAGFAEPWEQPARREDMVIWLLEQYMALTVEFGADLVFMFENFCGHGFVATGADADRSAPCYRGPGAALWFDVTCIHPSPAGHRALADQFFQTIRY
jgi:hypothetical protein